MMLPPGGFFVLAAWLMLFHGLRRWLDRAKTIQGGT
jgi:hypothetical protein